MAGRLDRDFDQGCSSGDSRVIGDGILAIADRLVERGGAGDFPDIVAGNADSRVAADGLLDRAVTDNGETQAGV